MKSILKSVFITVFPAFAIYVLIDSALNLNEHGFSFRYLGSLIVAFSIAFFFAGLFIKPQARTSRNLIILTTLIIIGFCISVIMGSLYENSGILGSYISLLLVVGWWLYLKWFSVFKKREKNILKVGNQLPVFELEDISKQIIKSTSYIGQPTIFLFYRGNWCPLCMAQIKEIASQYKELEKRGVTMNFISPQPHHFSKTLARKYNLGFNFLTDVENKVAKQLDIFSKNGIPTGFQAFGFDSDTVMPTVVITDANGKIIFTDLTDNYRVRPEPETFLKILDESLVYYKNIKNPASSEVH